MEKLNIPKEYKGTYIAGLIFNLASFLFYLLIQRSESFWGFPSGEFMANYALAFIYAIVILVNKVQLDRPRRNIYSGCWINLVLLCSISAFALNKEMSVFAAFPVWLNIYTLVMVFSFLLFPFVHLLPTALKIVLYLFTGASLVLSIYMVMFLAPIMPFAALVFWVLGISLHIFVPVCWVWLIIDFLARKSGKDRLKHFTWLGVLLPLIFLGLYLYKWKNIQTDIKDIIAMNKVSLTSSLPDEIVIAQKLPADPLAEEILITPFKAQKLFDNNASIDRNGSKLFHDPPALIAREMFGDIGIDEKTVEAVLNIRKDFRHLTQRRLWTGTSLSTTSISNNIRLFPQYRLTYHEKTFVIHNDENKQDRDWWFTANTQEALYTFHVPEGSIVTSLSLWINGREEKSRLSTARKADSAYTTVVGVERRDPAVVHWQEGNRITVNVFPCTKEEDRTFKIGFTAPMKIENGKMWLENIWFEGPEFSTAREVTQIFVDGESPMPIDLPGNFEKNAAGDYVYQGDYIPYWKIAFDPLPLSKNKFAFGGYEYSLKDLAFVQKDLKISEVYLDVTNEWTREEYNEALSRLDGMNVYAWVPAKVKITAENRGKVWEEVSINCFSAPFLYDITDPAHTAIITKTGPRSPVLEDMKGSLYADKMGKYIVETSAKVHVINIGQETSPLWRSLHELRLVDYSKSSLSAALDEVKSGKFTVFPEDSMTVALIDCKLGIVKKKVADTTLKSSAPDHLLRIFAYNDVLRKIGKRYFEKEKYEDELFRETEEGYVVTPVSSMIVLESAQDYERMGIDENKNTVGNASVMGGGAVPEPHEWLLIITVAAFILYQLYTRFKTKFGRA